MGRSLGWFVGLSLLAASCGTRADDAEAVESALTAPSNPATVPSIPIGKTMAPSGNLMDSACVFEVPNGAIVDANGNVIVNGSIVDHHTPCTPEQMGSASPASGTIGVVPPAFNGWADYSWANATYIDGLAYYNGLFANWTVPNNPTDPYYQIVYLFPSFESSNEIIQPVLQWGNNGSFGGQWWTIASWYVSGSSGTHSPPLKVYAGDSLLGQITIADSVTKGQYEIITTDQTQGGEYTYLYTNTSHPMTSVQGGVLEEYNMTTCTQNPSSWPVTFSNIEVWQAGPGSDSFNLVVPSWAFNQGSGLLNCAYGGSVYNDGGSRNYLSTTTISYVN